MPERYTFAGTLTAHGIVVASPRTAPVVGPGVSVELLFARVRRAVHRGRASRGDPQHPLHSKRLGQIDDAGLSR